ncbi:MAG TPA: protein kinase [Phycisphaerae bacterium]|nr:protein kinase [Phycisphaerae bacterium]HNU45108.1 protein kinase [Phycisphaerae bacterium]
MLPDAPGPTGSPIEPGPSSDERPIAGTSETATPGIPWLSSDSIGRLLQARILGAPPRLGLLASVGRFEVLRFVGEGGMAVVVEAHDPRHPKRRLALKLLREQFVQQPRVVHRFLTEARHMKHLAHPDIVEVIEVSDRPEGPYFVMPLMEHGSLAQHIRPGRPLDESTVRRIGLHVARALAFAHDKGIIHRDLKPGNVLLDAEDRAYLADFGLGRCTFLNESLIDVQRTPIEGTPPYLAPEIAAGKAGDFRGDIYAFGALLYEMLSGALPYDGATPQEVVERIVTGPPMPLREKNPQVSAALALIVEGCMARELRDRYADMGDVVADLERFERGESPLGPHGHEHHRRKPAPSRHAGARRRLRVGLPVLGVVVIAIAVVIGVRQFGRTRPAATPTAPEPRLPGIAAGPPEGPTPELASDAGVFPFVDEFEGSELRRDLWVPGEKPEWPLLQEPPGDRLGGRIYAENGALILKSHAACKTEGKPEHVGLGTAHAVWLDSRADVGQQAENVQIDVQLGEGEALNGRFVIQIHTAGNQAMGSGSSSQSKVLFAAGPATVNHRLTLPPQHVRIELSRTSKLAVVRAGIAPNAPFEVVDISNLPVWKLRFLVGTQASAGVWSGEARFAIERVEVKDCTDAGTTVAGFVTDGVTGRPIAGATVRTDQGAECETNALGAYIIPTDPGAGSIAIISASAPQYEPSTRMPVARLRSGYQRRWDVQLGKSTVALGDPIPGSCLVLSHCLSANGLAVQAGDMVLTGHDQQDQEVMWVRSPDTQNWEASLEAFPAAPLCYCGPTLRFVRRWIPNLNDDSKGGGQVGSVGPEGPGERVRWLPTPCPTGVACDGKRLWYISDSWLASRHDDIYALDLEILDREGLKRGGAGVVGQATSADSSLAGIAFGSDASGQDRLWVSSYSDEPDRGPSRQLRGLVYVVDPEALLRRGFLPEVQTENRVPIVDGEVVVAAFEGFWYQLSYDGTTQTLWGLDLGTKRICQLCIDPPCSMASSEPTPEVRPAPASESGGAD